MTQPPASPRIGVFGGAFDPPHVAHLALARQALAQLQLDQLRILPTGQAWHKARGLTAPEHRLVMAQLAFASLPQTLVDDREMRRQGATYTIDTLRQLQDENPGARLYLIIGADQALALGTWREWQAVLQIATITVAVRGADDAGNGPNEGNAVAQLMAAMPPCLMEYGRFEWLRMQALAVSATQIRERVQEGLGIADLVTEPIARYIAQNHLYHRH